MSICNYTCIHMAKSTKRITSQYFTWPRLRAIQQRIPSVLYFWHRPLHFFLYTCYPAYLPWRSTDTSNVDITDLKDNPLLFTEEGIHRYCRGGFHPVSLGDKFHNGQYTVHHKLGFGESCTVWLAKDNHNVWHRHGPWVALKILAARIKERREIRNLRYLKEKTNYFTQNHNIVGFLDTFLIIGPNGTHHCLVFSSFGPTIELIQQFFIDFNNYGDYLEFGDTEFSNSAHCLEMGPSSIYQIAMNGLFAVELMPRLEMCHGGISGSHIIIDYNSRLHFTSIGECFEILGSPQAVPLEHRDGMPLGYGLPEELIQTAKWPGYVESISDSARLIGFGKSFLRREGPDNLKQPVHLRCPESIMGDEVDYRLYLWHTGCFLYQLGTMEPPFPTPLNDYEYIRSIVGFVEGLPMEWESKLDEVRLISEQTFALEQAPATKKQGTELQLLRTPKQKAQPQQMLWRQLKRVPQGKNT
ncbi:unnamed protein product [Penicillium egyptiacum]|uniref:non-specific serine/threonine protein kinase n=1 Tax=Penicillium egyptiacum TaxID=1303716 RepID=A0A9W4KB51_9EURO|nr:unnamed protein product [Penicillium egyptiacum]